MLFTGLEGMNKVAEQSEDGGIGRQETKQVNIKIKARVCQSFWLAINFKRPKLWHFAVVSLMDLNEECCVFALS